MRRGADCVRGVVPIVSLILAFFATYAPAAGFTFAALGDAPYYDHEEQTFVEMLGFSPMEAILAATKHGGEIMGMGNELGQIKEGYLADLLLVDGDPIANVRVLQEKDRLLAIMKDGKFHKKPQMQEARRRLTA